MPDLSDVKERIAQWQAEITAGTISTEDYREIVRFTRGGRIGAGMAAAKSRAGKAPPKSTEELMDMLKKA